MCLSTLTNRSERAILTLGCQPVERAAHRRRGECRLLRCRLVIGHPRRSLTSPPEQPGRGRSPRAIPGRRAGLVAAGFALLCLLLTACSGGPQDGLAPSGIYARRA